MMIEVEVRQVGPSTAQGEARQHRVLVDRPADKGGADRGMMGGEYLLVALGGCFMSNLLAAVAARGADVRNARVRVVGTLAAAPSRYAQVELTVEADAPDREQLAKLVEVADRGCIVANTLRHALELRVRVAGAPVPA